MNSLLNLGKTVKKTAFALLVATSLVISVAAQRVDSKSEGLRYGDAGFRGEPINLSVVNADIRDILSYITDQYGINFVIDRSVKEVPVTVKLSEVPWNIALDSVLQSQSLRAQVNGNILRVVDSKVLSDEIDIQAKLNDGAIDNTPLTTELIRLNYARAKDGVVRGTLATGTGIDTGGNVSGSSFNDSRSLAPVFGTAQAGATGSGSTDGILPIIQRRLSRRGSIEVDSRSNSLIVTDVASNISAIKQLIAILDQPEPQVEIEARIVVASRSFSRDIGVQLAGLVLGRNGGGAQGGTLPTTGAPNNLPGGNPNGNLASQLANTAIGLTTGIFGTAQISALITAGEQKGQAKVIATPRVTALNNQKAEIKSGSKIPITTVQPGSAAGGAAIATTTYVDVPLRLEITPQITDLGTVILDVVAENSSTASIVGGAPPAINTQSMKTQVVVPDGGTTVVGGVLFDDERENQDRTPGLSRIPLLGQLFKRKAVQRNTNEILFFITPRISRPDFSAVPYAGAPRPSSILQPVPMGNPPSNSTRNTETLPVVQGPALARPEVVTNPNKP